MVFANLYGNVFFVNEKRISDYIEIHFVLQSGRKISQNFSKNHFPSYLAYGKDRMNRMER